MMWRSCLLTAHTPVSARVVRRSTHVVVDIEGQPDLDQGWWSTPTPSRILGAAGDVGRDPLLRRLQLEVIANARETRQTEQALKGVAP